MADDNMITLALTRAQATSKRAGVSWSLTDSHNTLLNCDAIIAGFNPQKLEWVLKKHEFTADHLFLSIEPVAGIFRVGDLIKQIETSKLSKITIGKRLPEHVADKCWRQWETRWTGQIITLEPNPVSDIISYGIERLRTSGRPWVTCVTAANFTGIPVTLSSLEKEFGFHSFLEQQISQSRALFYTSNQACIIESLPTVNLMDEEVETYAIEDQQNLESLLRYCASKQCYSALILSDMNTLSYLINQDLVDEIVHHITNSSCHSSTTFSVTDHLQLSNSLFGLRNWKLIDSALTGECNRLILSCKAPIMYSGRGLN